MMLHPTALKMNSAAEGISVATEFPWELLHTLYGFSFSGPGSDLDFALSQVASDAKVIMEEWLQTHCPCSRSTCNQCKMCFRCNCICTGFCVPTLAPPTPVKREVAAIYQKASTVQNRHDVSFGDLLSMAFLTLVASNRLNVQDMRTYRSFLSATDCDEQMVNKKFGPALMSCLWNMVMSYEVLFSTHTKIMSGYANFAIPSFPPAFAFGGPSQMVLQGAVPTASVPAVLDDRVNKKRDSDMVSSGNPFVDNTALMHANMIMGIPNGNPILKKAKGGNEVMEAADGILGLGTNLYGHPILQYPKQFFNAMSLGFPNLSTILQNGASSNGLNTLNAGVPTVAKFTPSPASTTRRDETTSDNSVDETNRHSNIDNISGGEMYTPGTVASVNRREKKNRKKFRLFILSTADAIKKGYIPATSINPPMKDDSVIEGDSGLTTSRSTSDAASASADSVVSSYDSSARSEVSNGNYVLNAHTVKSDYLSIKGIVSLSNNRYRVQLNTFKHERKKFSRNCNDLVEALWIFEICLLISDAPPSLEAQLKIGNFYSLSRLPSESFDFYTTPEEYYLELGRQIVGFQQREEIFTSDHLSLAVHNFDSLRVTNLLSADIAKQFEKRLLDAPFRMNEKVSRERILEPSRMEQESKAHVSRLSKQLVEVFSHGKTLKTLGLSCTTIFSDNLFPLLHFPPKIGMIKEE